MIVTITLEDIPGNKIKATVEFSEAVTESTLSSAASAAMDILKLISDGGRNIKQ